MVPNFSLHILLFCLFLAGFGYGQEKKAATEQGKETSMHLSYLDSARAVKTSDLKKSIDYIAQSIASLGDQGYEKELATSLSMLGEIYLYHGQTDLAIANLEDAKETHSTSRILIQLGWAYLKNGDFGRSEEVVVPLLEQQGLIPYQKVEVYEIIGDVKTATGQTNEAIAHYRQAITIAEKNQITPKVIDLNSKMADAYEKAGRLQEARAYYDNSLELSSSQAPQRAVREKEKVADFYNKNRQYDEEIALRKRSLSQLKDQPVPASAGAVPAGAEADLSPQRIAYKIANAYIAQDQVEQAIPYLEESIEEAGADDDLDVQKEATKTLSEVYREKGDYNRALESYRQYVTLVDSLYKRKEQQLSETARLNREIAEKQSRITGLEQERQLSQSRYQLAISEQELFEERSNFQQLIIYSLAFGMLLLALTAFFFYRSHRQQKLANNLLALKSLRSQMNPHFIFNALHSVNSFIATNDERSANRYLSEFSQLMRAVLENSEEDFISLARELELIRLYLKLEHSRFPDKFEYALKLDKGLDTEAFQIPPMLLQPYIENAIWHGLRYKEDQGKLQIGLEEIKPGILQITIEDDGIGRKKSLELKTPQQQKHNSRGMQNTEQRIKILNDMYGGRIDVQVNDRHADGTGTVVVIILKKTE